MAEAPTLPGRTAVITYTKEAAETVKRRSPELTAGTIYKLSWPLVRKFGSIRRSRPQTATYHQRPIRGEFDAALDEYAEGAPSNFTRNTADELAEGAHGWDGTGSPPFDPTTVPATFALSFILPIMRWFAAGQPGLTDEARYDNILVDESQDVGPLELAMIMALLRPGGRLICYGDPGQALYAPHKGLRGAILPAAWRLPGERRVLTGGHRCGNPLALAAARVLKPVWDRPASTFAAPHTTAVEEWWPRLSTAHVRGDMVLSYSRAIGRRYIQTMGLRNVALVPSQGDRASVVVSTGHSAKGSQADDVYLLPWSDKALDLLDEGEPSTVRLLYTMLTRAKRRIFVPSTLLARMGL